MNKDDLKMIMGAGAILALITIIFVSSYVASHSTGEEQVIAKEVESEAEELLVKEITHTH